VPTSTENQILHKAGLGLKKIRLDLDDNVNDVKEKITSKEVDDGVPLGFPQLCSCGGFELMCCTPNCRDLNVIENSWAARSLKTALGGGQAKIYLRPIQISLSTSPLAGTQNQSSIKEKCIICGKEVLIRELRVHSWMCSDKAINESDESTDEDAAGSANATGSDITGSTNTTRSVNTSRSTNTTSSSNDTGSANAVSSANQEVIAIPDDASTVRTSENDKVEDAVKQIHISMM